MSSRLLPGEQRRPGAYKQSVDEASTPTARSVQSIRQRFEADRVSISTSAPTTPAKKRASKLKSRTQTKTQVELAAFLKAGKERASNSPPPHIVATQPRRSPVHPAASSAAAASGPSNVGSLIEKWSSPFLPRQADRQPLQERHLQRDEPALPAHLAIDSVDTFGSSSVDIDQSIPKTDPGRLESYAAQARHLAQPVPNPIVAAAAMQPSSGDQSLKEIVTRGINRKDPRLPPKHIQPAPDNKISLPSQQPLPSNLQDRLDHFMQNGGVAFKTNPTQALKDHPDSTKPNDLGNKSSASTTPESASFQLVFESSPDTEDARKESMESTLAPLQPPSDWGAGDVYIRELFSEAEETAERAVRCDEQEQYFEAFELYWGVVDLYSKVIPFLTPAEGVDVHERIKMYTRRCEVIRQAFEDESDEEGTDPEEVDSLTPMDNPFQVEEPSVEQASLVRTFSNGMNIAIEDAPPRNPNEKPRAGNTLEAPPAPVLEKIPDVPAGQTVAQKEGAHRQKQSPSPAKQEVIHRQKPSQAKPKPVVPPIQGDSGVNGELRRTPYPDYASERPLANIPEIGEQRNRPFVAPGNGPGISASTQAHRNSLSRPISKTAARASTNSVSRERVAEMQERVNLMQECLNNFTVKQKHLGPARALELAVTTLNANTFGDLKKLEPLAPELEHKWSTELEVLLSMLKEIKEVRPGIGYSLREDIVRHLPALERCDRSVRKTMRSFGALAGHVRYVERETAGGSAKGGRGRRRWWVKVPVVEDGGLPCEVFQIVEEAEQEMRGVFKICHEINVEVVKEIPVPPSFVDGLPKHARSLIPRELKEGLTTWGMFKVSDYMKDRNMWSKESAKEITSSLEKVALIWEARTSSNKSFLSRTFDLRGDRFQQAMTAFRRCQNAIRDLRRDWPTMQHTELDMAKIQHNEDIGLAGLEAYSRALESRAYRLLTRIRELLDANKDAGGSGDEGGNS